MTVNQDSDVFIFYKKEVVQVIVALLLTMFFDPNTSCDLFVDLSLTSVSDTEDLGSYNTK